MKLENPDISKTREPILRVKNLKTQFFVYDGIVKALENINFTLYKGEILGLVGETGCGKSVTAYSITKLIADPPGRIVGGEIYLGNLNILRDVFKEAKIIPREKKPKVKRKTSVIRKNELFFNQIRGKYISMIFQEPMAALNPVYTIEDQITETLFLHRRGHILEVSKDALKNKSILSDLKKRIDDLKSQMNIETNTRGKDISSLEDDKAASAKAEFNSIYNIEYVQTNFPDGKIKEELIKVIKTKKGIESFSRHIDMLLESADAYSKRSNKYDALIEEDHRIEVLRGQLLTETDENKKEEIEKKLAKYTKRINLIKLSKQLKRNRKIPMIIEARREALYLLESVNIPDAYGVLKRYPHELSGGMLQRVVISIALANDPEILIADEPTTALDVTVQAQILEIMRTLQRERQTSIILITHDLGVIAEMCDRVAVMYAGNIVEIGEIKEIFHNPKHPYTIGLISSIPRIDNPDKKLKSIGGTVPNLLNPPSGCRFNPRCPFAFDRCRVEVPTHIEVEPGHVVACHLFSGKEVNDY